MDKITDKMRANWKKYAKTHTAVEFSCYLKYHLRQLLINEGSSELKFWADANGKKLVNGRVI